MGDGPGGTAAFAKNWEKKGRAPLVVDINEIRDGLTIRKARRRRVLPAPTTISRKEAVFEEQIVSLLFADVVGYSKLTDEQIPRFVKHFIGGVASMLEGLPERSAPLKFTFWRLQLSNMTPGKVAKERSAF